MSGYFRGALPANTIFITLRVDFKFIDFFSKAFFYYFGGLCLTLALLLANFILIGTAVWL